MIKVFQQRNQRKKTSKTINKPIAQSDYNDLVKRYNEVRGKITAKSEKDQKDLDALALLGKMPIGLLLRTAWKDGENEQSRAAFKQIKDALDSL